MCVVHAGSQYDIVAYGMLQWDYRTSSSQQKSLDWRWNRTQVYFNVQKIEYKALIKACSSRSHTHTHTHTHTPADWMRSRLGGMITHLSRFSLRCFITSRNPHTYLRFALARMGSLRYCLSWNRTRHLCAPRQQILKANRLSSLQQDCQAYLEDT